MDTLTLIRELDAQGVTGRERRRRLEAHKQQWQQAEAQERAQLAQRYELEKAWAAQQAQRVRIPEKVIQEHTDDPVTAQLRRYLAGLALPGGGEGVNVS
jgi:hypothetical protein